MVNGVRHGRADAMWRVLGIIACSGWIGCLEVDERLPPPPLEDASSGLIIIGAADEAVRILSLPLLGNVRFGSTSDPSMVALLYKECALEAHGFEVSPDGRVRAGVPTLSPPDRLIRFASPTHWEEVEMEAAEATEILARAELLLDARFVPESPCLNFRQESTGWDPGSSISQSFSIRGERVALLSERSLFILERDDEWTRFQLDPVHVRRDSAFSDGRSLWFFDMARTLRRIDLDALADPPEIEITAEPLPPTCSSDNLRLSGAPDGRELVLVTRSGAIVRFDLTDTSSPSTTWVRAPLITTGECLRNGRIGVAWTGPGESVSIDPEDGTRALVNRGSDLRSIEGASSGLRRLINTPFGVYAGDAVNGLHVLNGDRFEPVAGTTAGASVDAMASDEHTLLFGGGAGQLSQLRTPDLICDPIEFPVVPGGSSPIGDVVRLEDHWVIVPNDDSEGTVQRLFEVERCTPR